MKCSTIALACAALFAVAPHAASAQVALTLNPGGADSGSSFTRGWSFSLSSPITVTSLGWYDAGNDGLTDSHAVAIWTASGKRLITGTVPAGLVAALDNRFRYTSDLTGTTTLAPGAYVIGGQSTQGDLNSRMNDTNAVFDPRIGYISNASNNAAGLFSFPSATQPSLDIGVFGPNFRFTSSTGSAPEPATWVMLLFGFGMAGHAMRRRQHTTRVAFSVA